MKAKDAGRHELIGSTIKVIDSENPSQIGIKGKIVDETKNTFILTIKSKILKLIKKQITFEIISNNQNIKLKGSKLIKRPEERIK